MSGTTTTAGKERRRAARTAARLPAVLMAKGSRKLNGTVVNLSSRGAHVRLGPHDFSTGEHVTLYLRSDRTEVDGEVVWTNASHVGIRFLSVFRRVPRKVDHIKTEWIGAGNRFGKR